MNASTKKVIMLIFAIVYFVSPLDFMPGIIIDDIIALGIALTPFLNAGIE